MKVPADLYARSPRVYRGLEELTYPFHDQTIMVTGCGRICFRGRKVNLSHVFAGQSVGVTQVGERIWLVTFMQYDLGYFDDETCRLEPIENPFGAKLLGEFNSSTQHHKRWEAIWVCVGQGCHGAKGTSYGGDGVVANRSVTLPTRCAVRRASSTRQLKREAELRRGHGGGPGSPLHPRSGKRFHASSRSANPSAVSASFSVERRPRFVAK